MSEPGESLSERELEVLNCVIRGASNREIALELAISHNTVKVHLRNVFAKLGVSSRTEATTVALQQRLVVMPGLESAAAEPVAMVTDETALALPKEDEETEGAPAPLEEAKPVAKSPQLNFRLVSLGLILVIAAVLLTLTGSGLLSSNPSTPPSSSVVESFEETPLGETRWLISRPAPVAKANMAVAAVGLNLYQIGGETADGIVNSVDVFETNTHRWRSAAPKLTAVADVTAAVLFGEIYVAGGRLADGRPTAVVEAYSPANNAWRRVAALPQPVAGGLTLSDGSFLYFFGGWNGEEYLAESFVYDPGADGWRPLPPMAQARAFAAGGVVLNRLYVLGGFDGQRELAECQFFESNEGAWFDCPDMLLARGGASASVLFNKLYVFGGGLKGQIRYNESYDPDSQRWQVLNTPMLTERPAWTHLGAAAVERRIYTLGGWYGEEVQAGTFVYAPFPYQSFIPAASVGGEDN